MRWRELEIAPDGTVQKVLRYETLGDISRAKAAEFLAQKVGASANGKDPTRSRVTFGTIVDQWNASVVPMYKHSTQRNHRHIAAKHLVPQFGARAISEVRSQDVQAYVAQLTKAGYAPKTNGEFAGERAASCRLEAARLVS
jgi:hypothetical protein